MFSEWNLGAIFFFCPLLVVSDDLIDFAVEGDGYGDVFENLFDLLLVVDDEVSGGGA